MSLFNRSPPTQPEPVLAPLSLDQLFAMIEPHGMITLYQFSRHEWSACVKMHSSIPGASLEIKSGFNHRTPTDALQVCIDRLNAVFRTKVLQ